MTDWSGRDYAEDSGLQHTMITEAMAALSCSPEEWVLDIGCGDGFLTRAIADWSLAGERSVRTPPAA